MLRANIGTVTNNADISQTGKFLVSFGSTYGSKAILETVRYVSPMGNSEQAFIAIPPVGSQVLCLFEDDTSKNNEIMQGYYYVGSVMGVLPGFDNTLPPEDTSPEKESSGESPAPYIPHDKPGLTGPPIPPGKSAKPKGDLSVWPDKFKDMYLGKGVIPEQMGLTNYRGDAFQISNRASSNNSSVPFQDYRTGMYSGSGKRFELVDSGIVNGIVMDNEHKGKDYFIWCSESSPESPYSEGEYHMRTHGPVNMYTLHNNYAMWVEDGFNFEIKNNSTARLSYGDGKNGFTSSNPDSEIKYWGINKAENGGPKKGGYKKRRKNKFGNETTGCIKLVSKYNNISLSALEVDSVIHIHAPGVLSKVIIDTSGSVDIVAQGKITLQSKTEVEINAPKIDINAGKINGENEPPGNVYIDGDEVHINDPITDDMLDPPPEL
tara:strand:- start:5135 stop:6436 length:1302 start_codon:yes stop_codon:yes gene_type:complete